MPRVSAIAHSLELCGFALELFGEVGRIEVDTVLFTNGTVAGRGLDAHRDRREFGVACVLVDTTISQDGCLEVLPLFCSLLVPCLLSRLALQC